MTLVAFNPRRSNGPGSTNPPPPAPEPMGDLRFRRLLSDADWNELPPAVRARFSHRLGPGDVVSYSGAIIETRMTRYGWLLANLLRLAGAPLPLDTDNVGAAALVAVTERPDGCGQFWTRQYGRRRGFPQVIHSTKMFSGPTGLEEQVGAGITMSLRLAVTPGRLLFVSDRYFLKLGRLRLPIPGNMLLGRIIVGHVPTDDGGFDFTLEVRHPLFGLVVAQRARFHDLALAEPSTC
jgi:hypothetical protein